MADRSPARRLLAATSGAALTLVVASMPAAGDPGRHRAVLRVRSERLLRRALAADLRGARDSVAIAGKDGPRMDGP